MIDFILNEASTLQFALVLILLITGIMIILQALVSRAVWNWYLIGFFGAGAALLVTLR